MTTPAATLAADPAIDPVEAAIARVQRDARSVCIDPGRPITEEYLVDLSARHEGIRCESTAEGELIISGSSGSRITAGETDLIGQIWHWERPRGVGTTRHPHGGFDMEEWGFKVPDISWISYEREASAPRDRRGFLPVAPEFVIEVRSATDRLSVVKEKMVGWTTHGVLLGLLVDPQRRNVHIYRNGEEQQILRNPDTVSCEPEMPGLTLDFARVWQIMDD